MEEHHRPYGRSALRRDGPRLLPACTRTAITRVYCRSWEMPLGRDRRRQADRQRHICFATAESLAMPGFAAVCQITKHRL